MYKLNQLIQELCPDGVKYQELNQISDMKRGTSITKKDVIEGAIPVISGGREPAYYCDKYNREGETITVAGSGAGAGYVQYWDIPIFVCDAFSIQGHEGVSTKYLYYCLSNKQEYIYSTKKGGGVPHVHISSIENMQIPVPPLPVQREIVRILDNFTDLTADLTADLTTELTARRKQYIEYLNILISKKHFSNYDIVKMGDLFDFRNGLSKGKEFFGKGIPFIRYTDVYNNRMLHKENISALVECTTAEKQKLNVTRGDVLFTRTSETAEDVGWSSVMLDDIGDCVFNGFTIRATPKTKYLLPEYCAYCFSTDEFRQYVASQCAFTTRASLTGKTIAEYELVVPSIEDQKKVISILDRLYSLCNDLTSGLPAEIEARKKQYEYYRDKLLSFKSLSRNS